MLFSFSLLFVCFYVAFLRLEVILQEQKIHQLKDTVDSLTDAARKCDRLRKKDRKFLQTLIESSKSDNVPLSEEQCSAFCRQNKVKFHDCEELCSPAVVRCSHWPDSSKCLKQRNITKRSIAENVQLTTTPRSHFYFSREPHLFSCYFQVLYS